jgi:hypothetical protein
LVSAPFPNNHLGGRIMLYVGLMRMRECKLQSGMAQRMQWEIPEGVKMVAEYWLTTNDPKVISIFEVDDPGPIMEIQATWDDVFDIKIFSAVTAEEGMEWIKQVMG